MRADTVFKHPLKKEDLFVAVQWPARQHKYTAGDPSCGSDTEQTPFPSSPASSWHAAPQVRVTATIVGPKPQHFQRNQSFWSPRRAEQRAVVGSPGHAQPKGWGGAVSRAGNAEQQLSRCSRLANAPWSFSRWYKGWRSAGPKLQHSR